jgi:hypothetical protein
MTGAGKAHPASAASTGGVPASRTAPSGGAASTGAAASTGGVVDVPVDGVVAVAVGGGAASVASGVALEHARYPAPKIGHEATRASTTKGLFIDGTSHVDRDGVLLSGDLTHFPPDAHVTISE